jgi:hypothetical protein
VRKNTRIDKLEARLAGTEESSRKTVVLIVGEPEPTEDVNIIWVTDEKARELTLRIIAGEGIEKEPKS